MMQPATSLFSPLHHYRDSTSSTVPALGEAPPPHSCVTFRLDFTLPPFPDPAWHEPFDRVEGGKADTPDFL